MKTDYRTRVLMLYLKLNQHSILYTPLSPHGLRAAKLMPRLAAILEEA